LKVSDVEYGGQVTNQAKAIAIYPFQAHVIIRTKHEPIWERPPFMHCGIRLGDLPDANNVEAVAKIFSGTCASQYLYNIQNGNKIDQKD
jgi:hypothetical protein